MTRDDDRLAAIEARLDSPWLVVGSPTIDDGIMQHVAAERDDLRYLLARARQLDALADAVLAGRWTEADEIARKARGGNRV